MRVFQMGVESTREPMHDAFSKGNKPWPLRWRWQWSFAKANKSENKRKRRGKRRMKFRGSTDNQTETYLNPAHSGIRTSRKERNPGHSAGGGSSGLGICRGLVEGGMPQGQGVPDLEVVRSRHLNMSIEICVQTFMIC